MYCLMDPPETKDDYIKKGVQKCSGTIKIRNKDTAMPAKDEILC